jgi:hypothetical protein
MTDIQQALVADHIATLAREASALRAERELLLASRARAADRGGAGAGTDTALASDITSPRVRIGRWLVAVGEVVAGSTMATRRAAALDDARCEEGPDRLAPAA